MVKPLPQYKYVAIGKDGKRVTGLSEGANEAEAAARIRESGQIIERMTPIREGKGGLLNMEIGGSHLDTKAFVVVCNQFSIILGAGIPIGRAVKLIADKTSDKPLHKLLEEVAKDVEGGRSMAASFSERGAKLLPPTFIEMIRAGESTGNLSSAFETMAAHFDKQNKIRAKVVGAMAYPAFIMVLAVGVVIVLMGFVVPRFTETFADMGSELPAITRSLIVISNFFKQNALIILGVLVVLVAGYLIYYSSEKGRMVMDGIYLKLPVLGSIQELTASSQFASTMASTLSAGLPVNRAVDITAKVIDNRFIQTEAAKLVDSLESGHALGETMQEQGVYPDILVDMVSVGEETGELEHTLRTIAGYYDNELDEAIKSALAKLEPALLVFIAAIAGYIVIAIYMSIFGLYGSMQNLT